MYIFTVEELISLLCPELRQKLQDVQNIKESKRFCKALRVLQILALALLLLQWECVWIRKK